jgi:RNA recognition motif-containing protein
MTPASVSKKRKFEEIDGGNDIAGTEDDRVLSHAAQRRLRKRLKTSIADGEESKTKPTENQSVTSHKSTQVSRYTIWIGNLSFKTTPDALKAFFGEISDQIVRVHMPTKSLHGTLSDNKKSRMDNKGYIITIFYRRQLS